MRPRKKCSIGVAKNNVTETTDDSTGGFAERTPLQGTYDASARVATAKALLRLMEAAGCREGRLRCALTGRVLTPETVSLDHIVPLSKGGVSTTDNIQFVTHEANQAKSTLSQEEFIKLCRDVVKTHGATEIT